MAVLLFSKVINIFEAILNYQPPLNFIISEFLLFLRIGSKQKPGCQEMERKRFMM